MRHFTSLLKAAPAALVMLAACSSMYAKAEQLRVDYEGVITNANANSSISPFGATIEDQDGFEVGDTVSGTLYVDLDFVDGLEPTAIQNPYLSWVYTYYNDPNPAEGITMMGYRSIGGVPLGSDSQGPDFVSGGYRDEDSTVNMDSVNVVNRTNADGSSGQSMTIANTGNFEQGVYSSRVNRSTVLRIRGSDFLTGLGLRQTFSMAAGGDGYYYRSNSAVPEGYESREAPEIGRIDFDITYVEASVVSDEAQAYCVP